MAGLTQPIQNSLNAVSGTVDPKFTGKVGINTTAPLNSLDVNSKMVIGSTFAGQQTAPDDGLLVQGSVGIGTSTPQNKLDIEGAAVIGVNYSGTITAPNNGLLIEGNVGIGTTTPSALLDVSGAIRAGVDTTAQSLLGKSYIGHTDGHTDFSTFGHIDVRSEKSSFAIGQNSSGQTTLNSKLGQNLLLSINESEKVRIDPSGQVGIGTSTPNNKLDVVGNVSIGTNYSGTFSAPTNGLLIEGQTAIGNVSPDPNSKLDVSGAIFGSYNTDTTSYFGRSAIGFSGISDHASFSHIDKNTSNDYALLQSSTGLTYINTSAGQSIRFRESNSDRMILTNGRLGIGTTSPLGNLDVRGTAYVGYQTESTHAYFGYGVLKTLAGNNFTIYHDSLKNSATSYAFWTNSFGGIKLNTSGASDFEIQNQASTKVIVKSTGLMGINNTSPSSYLDIYSNDYIGVRSMLNLVHNLTGTDTGSGTHTDTIANIQYTGTPNQSNPGDTIVGLNVDTGNITNITYKYAALFNGGDVGIGTTTPQAKLDIRGNTFIGETYQNTPAGTSGTTAPSTSLLTLGGYSDTYSGANSAKLYIMGNDNDGASNSYPIFIEDENGVDNFWIKNRTSPGGNSTIYMGGNVGIGVQNVTGTLEVSGSNKISLETSSSDGIQIGTTNNGVPIQIGHSTSEVSIGDNLTVGGNLIVQGTTTTVNSTVVTIDDPILTLGGDTAPTSNDGKDKGIEFRYYDGTARIGFMGYDRSLGKFTMLTNATNVSENFTGTKGTLIADIEGNASTADTLADSPTISNPTFTGTTTISSTFVYGSTTITSSPAEFNFLTGVTSNIQAQLNAKEASQWTTSLGNIYYNGGRVGIGLTNPSAKLEVNGNSKLAFDTDTISFIGRSKIGPAGSSDIASFSHLDYGDVSSYAFAQNSEGETIINTPDNKNIDLRVNDVSKVTIKSTGVGINNTNPIVELDVSGTISATDVSATFINGVSYFVPNAVVTDYNIDDYINGYKTTLAFFSFKIDKVKQTPIGFNDILLPVVDKLIITYTPDGGTPNIKEITASDNPHNIEFINFSVYDQPDTIIDNSVNIFNILSDTNYTIDLSYSNVISSSINTGTGFDLSGKTISIGNPLAPINLRLNPTQADNSSNFVLSYDNQIYGSSNSSIFNAGNITDSFKKLGTDPSSNITYERFSDSQDIFYYEYLTENTYSGSTTDSKDLFTTVPGFINPFSTGNTIVTFECKFKTTYYNPGVNLTLIEIGNTNAASSAGHMYNVKLTHDDRIQFALPSREVTYGDSNIGNLQDGNYHSIKFTFNMTTLESRMIIDGKIYNATVPGGLEGPSLTATTAHVGGFNHTPFIGDIKDVKFYHGEDLPSFNKYYEIFSTTVEDFKKQDKKAIITFTRDGGYTDPNNNKALRGGYYFAFGNDLSNVRSQINWNMTGHYPSTQLFDLNVNNQGDNYHHKKIFHNKNLDQTLLQKIRIYKLSNKLRMNEFQIWVDGSNIVQSNINSSYIGNYNTYPYEAIPSSNLFNGNIDTRNIASSFDYAMDNSYNMLYIELTRSFKVTEIQSIVLFNYRSGESLEEIQNEGLYNSYFELLDTSDNIFCRLQLTDNSNAYKIKGLAKQPSTYTLPYNEYQIADTDTLSGPLATTGVSIFNIEDFTESDTSSINLPLTTPTKPTFISYSRNFVPKYDNLSHHLDFINYNYTSKLFLQDKGNNLNRLNGITYGTLINDLSGIHFIDGSENSIDLSGVDIGGSFTMSIWFNIFNHTILDQTLVNFSENFNDNQKIEIKNSAYQGNKYSIDLRFSDNTGNFTTINTGYNLTRSTNHNITLSSNAQNGILYLDGNQLSSISTPNILKTKLRRGTHYLGRDPSSNIKDFHISKFSIWNTNLNSTEVSSLYNLGHNFKFENDISESKIVVKEPFTLSFNNGSNNVRVSNFNVVQESNLQNHFDFYNISDKSSNYGKDLGISTNKRNASIYVPYTDRSNDNSGIHSENLINNGKFNSFSNSPSIPTNTFILNGSSRSLTDKYSTTALTLNGSPTFDTNGVTLNGSGKYITIPQSILEFGSDDFTISLWIESIDDFNSNYQVIISMGTQISNNDHLLLVVNSSTTSYGNDPREIYYQATNSGTNTVVPTNFIYPNDGNSHNYIITKKNSIVKVFIDSVQKTSSTQTTLPNGDYFIGVNTPTSTAYLHGIIKRVDIWKGIGF